MAALLVLAVPAAARAPCADGLWLQVMVGAYHFDPQRKLDDFDPGIGGECYFAREWGVTAGYFRDSLLRPSFYGAAIYVPRAANWGWIRLGAVAGIISGYNFGREGFGANHGTGPIVAPTVIMSRHGIGLNLILIPPIPAAHQPLTLGFQAKFRLR